MASLWSCIMGHGLLGERITISGTHQKEPHSISLESLSMEGFILGQKSKLYGEYPKKGMRLNGKVTTLDLTMYMNLS